jgi:hypothetical protein
VNELDRERSGAHLIGDAARLFVPPVIDSTRLHAPEFRKRRLERLPTIQNCRLPPGRQRITPEEGRIQRHPGLRCQPFAVRRLGFLDVGEVGVKRDGQRYGYFG